MVMLSKSAAVKAPVLALIMINVLILSFVVNTVINIFADRHTKDQFKEAYGRYSQALSDALEDLGGDTGCFYSSSKNVKSNFDSCDNFYKTFAKRLNVAKYCDKDALAGGCVPKYREYAIKPACAGYSESMISKFDQVFVMGDRSSITVFNYPNGIQKPMFALDVNGVIGPNKVGYDLFSLVIMRNKNGHYYFYPDITYCLPPSKNGIKYLTDVLK